MNSSIVKHIIIWFLILLFFYFNNSAKSSAIGIVGFSFLFLFGFIITYYYLVFVAFPLAEQGKYFFAALIYLSAFGLLLVIDIINFKFLFPALHIFTHRLTLGWDQFLFKSLYWFFLIAVVAYGNMVLRINLHQTQIIQVKAVELLNLELGMLKSQFHSHLNFNFLNACYTHLIEISETSAEAVEHYSEMLRYSLDGHSKPWIKLEAELRYIEHFIALQKILSAKVNCEFTHCSDGQNYLIAPMLLGLLVENTFKHGVIHDPRHPIRIHLEVKNSQLVFQTKNLKSTNSQFKDNKYALSTFKLSLSHLYFDNFSFHINESTVDFETNLKLNLHV
jgi:two-component system, LytTR family, sensor kinase